MNLFEEYNKLRYNISKFVWFITNKTGFYIKDNDIYFYDPEYAAITYIKPYQVVKTVSYSNHWFVHKIDYTNKELENYIRKANLGITLLLEHEEWKDLQEAYTTDSDKLYKYLVNNKVAIKYTNNDVFLRFHKYATKYYKDNLFFLYKVENYRYTSFKLVYFDTICKIFLNKEFKDSEEDLDFFIQAEKWLEIYKPRDDNSLNVYCIENNISLEEYDEKIKCYKYTINNSEVYYSLTNIDVNKVTKLGIKSEEEINTIFFNNITKLEKRTKFIKKIPEIRYEKINLVQIEVIN